MVDNRQYSVMGYTLRPIEGRPDRRAEKGSGVIVDGQRVPLPPARRSGEQCKFPQWGSGRSPGKLGFLSILGLQK